MEQFLSGAIAASAFVISCVSIWLTRTLWLQSNRPIVVAEVRTSDGGNESIGYDLAVSNCGTRPAVDVRLLVKDRDLHAAFADGVVDNQRLARLVVGVKRCFSDEGYIAVLLHGERLTNFFGHTGTAGGLGSLWKMGAKIPIRLEYKDLHGRRYASHLTLRIFDSEGFAGSCWGKG